METNAELNLEQVINDALEDNPKERMYKTTRTLGRFTKALGRATKKAAQHTGSAIANTAKDAKRGLSDGWNS